MNTGRAVLICTAHISLKLIQCMRVSKTLWWKEKKASYPFYETEIGFFVFHSRVMVNGVQLIQGAVLETNSNVLLGMEHIFTEFCIYTKFIACC